MALTPPPPLGPSLHFDLEFMKHLSKVVNIIPVIAKADTMTLEEKSEFKQRVRRPSSFSCPHACLSPSGPSPLIYPLLLYPPLPPYLPPGSYSTVREARLVEKRS